MFQIVKITYSDTDGLYTVLLVDNTPVNEPNSRRPPNVQIIETGEEFAEAIAGIFQQIIPQIASNVMGRKKQYIELCLTPANFHKLVEKQRLQAGDDVEIDFDSDGIKIIKV